MRPDLTAMRVAGWHSDLAALRNALLEHHDQRLARAYEEGKRERSIGRTCGCDTCRAIAAAPPITVTITPRP